MADAVPFSPVSLSLGGAVPTAPSLLTGTQPAFSSPSTTAPASVNLGTSTPTAPSLLTSSQPTSVASPTGVSQPSVGSSFASGQAVEQRYNDLLHKVELYLDNSGTLDGADPATRHSINPSAVLNLSISNTINDWIVDGSLTFMYIPEDSAADLAATGGQNQPTAVTGAMANGQLLKSYQFRGDGFDVLRVMISPITKNTTGDPDAMVIDENDPKWYLTYMFSVYDTEDINDIPEMGGNVASYIKCLKLYFRDIRYQILKTTNIEYSTANSPQATFDISFDSVDASHQTGGVLKTGTAIYEILWQTLRDPANGGNAELMAPPGADQWDEGAGSLFYTSPAESSAADDVNYLLDNHVSTKQLDGSTASNPKDLCLLCTQKSKTATCIEEFALTPISDFFKKAGSAADAPGELQKEHFFVTSLTNSGGVLNTFRAPMGTSSDRDLKTAKYGQILSFAFVDMAAEANSALFISAPVYSVDIGNRIFNVEFQGNDVKTARTAIAQTYISQLYKQGEGDKLFLPTIHKTKKSVNVFPKFSLNGDNKIARQKRGLLDLIYTGLFQNACVCFKTLGLTMREPGMFIGIDKTDGCEDNDYNNKLYGQWFVVKVDHVFEAGSYVNMIYAIKIHRFKTPTTTFKDTIDTI